MLYVTITILIIVCGACEIRTPLKHCKCLVLAITLHTPNNKYFIIRKHCLSPMCLPIPPSPFKERDLNSQIYKQIVGFFIKTSCCLFPKVFYLGNVLKNDNCSPFCHIYFYMIGFEPIWTTEFIRLLHVSFISFKYLLLQFPKD